MKEAEKGLNNSRIKINKSVESPLINPTLENNISSSQVTPTAFCSSILENNTSSPQETVPVFSSPSQIPCTINNNEIPALVACTREVGVCTPVDLYLEFQLHALTDRCISLEKSLIEERASTLS